jgi:uncharacterized lipoprotein YajG
MANLLGRSFHHHSRSPVKSLFAALLALLVLAACQATPTASSERSDECRYPGQNPVCRGLHPG